MTAAFDLLFGRPGPRWFSIAAHRPFLADLALTLEAAFADRGPEALADAVVFTPTRRSGRELAQAFVRAAQGRAVLLPQIRAIGDLDEGESPFEPGELALELSPAVTPLRRRFELARLVVEHSEVLEREVDAATALQLADALAAFLDAIQIEEVDVAERLGGLVEGEMARHWLHSARFLALATQAWPRRLAELGLVDVAERRTALLRALAAQWRAYPPERPVVVAGSTNAAPAMAALLAEAARAPQGCVVLPGLDAELPDAVWAKVEDGHPQFALKRILELAGVARGAVADWPAPELQAEKGRARNRRRLVNEALRPAETTDDWRRALNAMVDEGRTDGHDPIARALDGLSLCVARGESEAASACAVLLREALETPGRTAALVTPDPALARSVCAALSRWGVEVDSSAGAPLSAWPRGVLITLAAQVLETPMAPATLLALVKHELTRLGLQLGVLEMARGHLERRGLRGPRPGDWAALKMRLQPREDRVAHGGEVAARETRAATEALDLAERLERALALIARPFAEGTAEVPDAARALAEGLEALAADAGGRTGELWSGPDGEAAAALLAGLIADGEALPPCTPRGFADIVSGLLAGEIVRGGARTHPRLRVLGLIEARLIGADLVVLAGLEEGVWPAAAPVDPFLSRPMRARLGLPSPERRIGQAAHDFAQAACAREVVMVTRERRGGQPAVRSRWLWRLQTLAAGARRTLPERRDALGIARALDAPLAPAPPALRPAQPPEPRPPLMARPVELPVTDVERLVRDPYALYAKRVLGLRRLDRPDERIEARARGTAIHKALELFARDWTADADPGAAAAAFGRLYREQLAGQSASEAQLAREAVLAQRLGGWVAEMETQRRAALSAVLVERSGAIEVAGVRLTCRADRLEATPDGEVNVLDYKTGSVPAPKQIKQGFAPQLPLTAAILARGGFADLGARRPGELTFLQIKGREPPGEAVVRAGAQDSAAVAEAAIAGLEALLARYADPETPYRSRIAPEFRNDISDYDDLARVAEWSAAGDAGEDA